MLDNFFQLNGEPHEVKNDSDFKSIVSSNDEIKNILYRPDILEPEEGYPRYKIRRKTFRNVSFTKTTLKDIDFTTCHFEDCLFIGTQIDNCQFHQCSFTNVNTHQIKIKRTYINPDYFNKNYKKKDIQKSNLAVHLFQELLDNSRDEEQSEFSRKANYNFKKWQSRLTRSKYIHKQPYKISIVEFLLEYVPNFIYRWIFGYGLRLRNFIATFIVTFGIFYFLNILFWDKYGFHQKDFAIASFNPNNVSSIANIYFTADAMTQLVDSQFQPSTNFGMTMLTIQGFSGFILLSFLITVLINRFVK